LRWRKTGSVPYFENMRLWRFFPLTLSLVVVAAADNPQPAPPAYLARRPALPEESAKSLTPGAALLEYDMGDPTGEEQMYLERINRARLRPLEEGFTLATSTLREIQEAYQFYNVDLQRVVDEIALYPVVQPLAFHRQLITAARGHTAYLLQNTIQEHEQRNPVNGEVVNTIESRITSAGYPWNSIGESIYSFGTGPEQGHAAFEVDWGNGDGGVQRPPGHRDNNHSAEFREIGVGVLNGTNVRITPAVTNLVNSVPVVTPAVTNKVGPHLVTLDFGRRSSSAPLVTGVAYYDVNTNGLYEAGEGIPGFRIEVPQGGSFAVTRRSGGYAAPGTPGANTVRYLFDGREIDSRNVTLVSGQNQKHDLVLPYSGSQVSGPTIASSSSANLYSVSEVLGATSYVWTQVRVDPYTFADGAEGGATNLVVSVSPGWDPVRTGGASAGTRKYQLVHITPQDQILTLRPILRPGAAGAVQFRSMLGFSTASQVATVEVSPVGTTAWIPVFTQRGWGTNGVSQTSYTTITASVAEFAGRDLKVRFRYQVEPGSYFNQSTASFGWHLDDIRVNGTDSLADPSTNVVSADRTFSFQPGRTGKFELGVQPLLAGTALPVVRAFAVSATTNAPLGGQFVIDSITRPGVGGFQVDFSLRSGVAGTWRLQGATSPSGPWSDVAGAILSTVSPGRFRFLHTPVPGIGFYRISIQ